MTGTSPLFTVFTPTYNRAHTLSRVYESLQHQTMRDFEWLIVDDGSTDGTATLVKRWQLEGELIIRYFHQEHRGAHCAINLGVQKARGRFWIKLDSDDACVPEGLATLWSRWQEIPENQKQNFVGVTGLCVDQNGVLVGDPFHCSPLDSTPPELRYRLKVNGDKFGFLRTEVLRENPFPENVDGNFIPEAYLWNKIARCYKTRYVNDIVLTAWLEGPSLTRGKGNVTVNAAGHRLHFMTMINEELEWLLTAPLRFYRAAANYYRFSRHCGVSAWGQCQALHGPKSKLLWLLAMPVGLGQYLRDRYTGRA